MGVVVICVVNYFFYFSIPKSDGKFESVHCSIVPFPRDLQDSSRNDYVCFFIIQKRTKNLASYGRSNI